MDHEDHETQDAPRGIVMVETPDPYTGVATLRSGALDTALSAAAGSTLIVRADDEGVLRLHVEAARATDASATTPPWDPIPDDPGPDPPPAPLLDAMATNAAEAGEEPNGAPSPGAGTQHAPTADDDGDRAG